MNPGKKQVGLKPIGLESYSRPTILHNDYCMKFHSEITCNAGNIRARC